jgi:phosphoglycolate phosphatase
MSLKAVIFDLDGTLLDTLADLAGSMNQVLRQSGWPEHPPPVYRYFVGDGMLNLARRALPPEARQDEVLGPVVAALREVYSRNWHHLTKPYPGVPELLQTLSRQAIPLGVLTNKPADLAQDMVRAYFPDIAFAAVAGAQPGRPLKPDPTVACALARKIALPPEAIVLVGDSGVDMQTARAAGMYAAGALWGFRPVAELLSAGAQTLLPGPADLLDLFTDL